jgi:hypothetical protein
MKAFAIQEFHRLPDDPQWIIVMSADGGDFEPVSNGQMFSSQAEAEAESIRLDQVENGKDDR